MTIDIVRERVQRFVLETTALAALEAALTARAEGRPIDPTLRERIADVLRAIGIASGSVDPITPIDAATILGEIRTYRATDASLIERAALGGRWNPTEPALMEAAGAVSARVPRAIASAIAPSLDGLSARLSAEGAAFLDVGVGVAVMSIEMARTWPNLRVVGVDPWAPALTLARENVLAAGLGSRIELRECAGEAIEYEHAFDLAWIPSLFVSATVAPEAVRRVRRALRPGGWLIVPMLKTSTDALVTSVMRLRVHQWGGWVADLGDGERVLAEAGFVDVRRLPAPPVAGTAMLAARAP